MLQVRENEISLRKLSGQGCNEVICFAADDPRWISSPSSKYPSTRDSVQKQVMLNAYEI